MAIIIGSEIKKAELQNIELDYNMEIDLINKTLKKMENFPTVVMEDNNSISIVMKAPLEYNGVDLMGTNCIVKYNTSWVDENGKNSAGQVDLTNTCIEKQDYLLYTWVLDINQTLKTGVCNFNVIFLMNLEEDPYINNTNVFITDEIEGELSYDSNIVLETNLKYWTISTKPEAINIQNSFSNIESDYNLILPENFTEELQKTNEKIEDIETDIENLSENIDINKNNIDINKTNIDINKNNIDINKNNIEQNKKDINNCATKSELITTIIDEYTLVNSFRIDLKTDEYDKLTISYLDEASQILQNGKYRVNYDSILVSGHNEYFYDEFFDFTESSLYLTGIDSSGNEEDIGSPISLQIIINDAGYCIATFNYDTIPDNSYEYYKLSFAAPNTVEYRIFSELNNYTIYNFICPYSVIPQDNGYYYIWGQAKIFRLGDIETMDENGQYILEKKDVHAGYPNTFIFLPEPIEKFGLYRFDVEIQKNKQVVDLATENYNKIQEIKFNLNSISKDYIIDYGETTVKGVTWTWEKWSSGKAECWCQVDYSNVKFTTAWGGLFTADTKFGGIQYPFDFIQVPQEHHTLIRSEALCFIAMHNENATTTTSATFNLLRATSVDFGYSVSIGIRAIGKWK